LQTHSLYTEKTKTKQKKLSQESEEKKKNTTLQNPKHSLFLKTQPQKTTKQNKTKQNSL
jgi:hypothetical protein